MVSGDDADSFFGTWALFSPGPFAEKTVLSPLNGLGTLAKKTFDHIFKGLF